MKKIIAFVLMLMMVLTMCPIMVSAVTLPDGTNMSAGYSDGTDHEGWTAVGTAAEFEKIAPGGKYYLTANIDLTGIDASKKWIIKGATNTGAAIVIDGCGYTVTTNRPIIHELPGGGSKVVNSEIKNLVIEGEIEVNGADFSGNGNSIGVLAGKANGGVFTNIVNNASVTQTDTTNARVSGLIGCGFNDNLYFYNCVNNGDITGFGSGNYAAGGLLGAAGSSYMNIFVNCANTGTVTNTSTAESDVYVGDFVGHNYSTSCTLILVNCVNKGVAVADNTTVIGADKGTSPAAIAKPVATPVAINTAADFAAMTADGSYYLNANITISESYAGAFSGYFDGNGYTVTATAPLFAEMNGAYVENVDIAITIADSKRTDAASTNTGALAASAISSYVSGVDVTGSIETVVVTELNQGFGGIIGCAKDSYIIDCTNAANISGSHKLPTSSTDVYVGGIVGVGDGTMYITGCSNSGNLAMSATSDAASSTYALVAGIAGQITKRGGTANVTYIENCSNSGSVSATTAGSGIVGKYSASGKPHIIIGCSNSGAISGARAGGMAGYSNAPLGVGDCVSEKSASYTATTTAGGIVAEQVTSTSAYVLDVYNCVNNTDISTGSGIEAGGIVGNVTAKTANVVNCVNNGEITSVKANNGGIVGYAKIGNSSDKAAGSLTIDGCINNGIIKTTTDNTASTNGGILGYQLKNGESATSTVTIKNCINNGKVESAGRAAGVAGWIAGTAVITDCTNTARIESTNVTTAHAYVGGIIAYPAGKGTIKGCLNTGEIFSTMTAGGIVSLANGASTTVTNCLNTGNVIVSEKYSDTVVRSTAYDRVAAGGIVGATTVAIKVNYCGNIGNVTNTSANASTNTACATYASAILAGAQKASTSDNVFNFGTITAGGAATKAEIGPANLTATNVYNNLTAEQIAGGYLAYKMQNNGYWGQTINTDKYPTLGGAAVKKAEGAEVYYNDGFAGNLTLKDDLTLNAWANASVLDASELTVKFTMNGETTDAIAASVADKYYAKAAFTDIAPQYIGEEIEVALYLGETELTSDTISIVEYLEKIVELDDEKNTDIAKALLRYGYEARAYVIAKNIAAEADVAEIKSDLLDTTALAAPTGVAALVHEKNPDYDGTFCFYSANVFFDNANSIRLTVYIPEAKAATAKVVIDGEEVELVKVSDGVYEASTAEIYAKVFGEQITAVLYDGETVVGTLKYSIDNYAERIAASTTASAEMKALALATYYYGAAAAAYAG